VVDGAPEIVCLAIDLHEYLVEVPAPTAGFHALDPAFSDLSGKHRTEAMPPIPYRLVTDIDAALVQQILDIPKRQREPNVQHHCQADDFRAALKALEWLRFGHAETLRGGPARLNHNLSDKTTGWIASPQSVAFGSRTQISDRTGATSNSQPHD